jgi:hypothetical protein
VRTVGFLGGACEQAFRDGLAHEFDDARLRRHPPDERRSVGLELFDKLGRVLR